MNAPTMDSPFPRAFMVRRLIAKDWSFNRWPILAYVSAGAAALAAIGLGGDGGFYAGSIGLITVLISIGIHLTMITVVNERKEQTLAFVMSLPVDVSTYTAAKLIVNVAIFGAAWLVLAVGSVAVIAGRAALPDGLIPFALTVLLEIFAGYVVMLGTALVSESMNWTIGAMVLGNLTVQAVMYWLSNRPAVQQDLHQNVIVWRPEILGVLGAEVAVIVVCLALTFYLQARKTDFL
jgi:hypothetical protein